MKVSNDPTRYTLLQKQPANKQQPANFSAAQSYTFSQKTSEAVSNIAKAKIAIDSSVPQGYEGAHRFMLALNNNPEYANIKNLLDDSALNYIEGQKFLNYDEGIKLLDFLKNRNPQRMYENSKTINRVFQNLRINDLAALFERINRNNVYQMFFPFYEIDNYGLLNAFNLTEIIDYINKKPELLPGNIDLDELSYYYDQEAKRGRITDFHPEKIIPELDKLSDFSKAAGEKAFGHVAKDVINKVLISDGEYVKKLNPERFEVLKAFASDVDTEKLIKKLLSESPEFLTETKPKLSVLLRNTEIIKKYAKLLSKKEIEISSIFAFQGDLEKLLQKLNKVMDSLLYDEGDMKYSINPENSRVLINDSNKYIDVYDAQMKPLFYETRHGLSYADRHVYNTKVEDKLHETVFSVSEYQNKKSSGPVLSEIIKNDKNSREILTEGRIDGIYDYYKLLPDNEKKSFIQTISDEKGITYKKELESLDGTKSVINYTKNEAGEIFDYTVKDKDGSIIGKKHIQVQKAGDNTFEHIINGNRFLVHHSDKAVSVKNARTGTEKTIVFSELIKNSLDKFTSRIKTFWADELEFLADNIKSIDSTEKLFDSKIVSDAEPSAQKTSEIIFAAEKPVILHELGHEKYRNEAINQELIQIFEYERRLFKDNMPPIIQDMTNYFLESNEHKKFRILTKPLTEAIAEINVILNTPFFLKETCARTHFLQQYFPKTIAFLMRRYL